MIYRDFEALRQLAGAVRYRLIYADPGWQYRDAASSGKRGAVHKYRVMSYREIARLPVPEIADPAGSLLAMWWVPTQDREARYVADAWGFNVRTMFGFVWVKEGRTPGTEPIGMGNWTRANPEACLLATVGRPKRASAGVRALVKAPRGAHSQKPDVVRQRLVQLVGDVPRIELFAREAQPGWDVCGDHIAGEL